jgi:hypothetical protein
VSLSVQNIRNPNPSYYWVAPIFALRTTSIRRGNGVESVPRGRRPIMTPLPLTFVLSWLDVLWVVDHSWYARDTVESEKPSSVAVVDTNRCAWHLLPYPVQRHFNILSCQFTLWMAHIECMHTWLWIKASAKWHILLLLLLHNPCLNCLHLKTPSLTCLLPFTDWSEFYEWHQ